MEEQSEGMSGNEVSITQGPGSLLNTFCNGGLGVRAHPLR